MAQIFISWSTADAAFVNRLASRLRQEGFTVDEYSTDANGGSIGRKVRGYVDSAELALICLSDQSVEKDWIKTETAWLEYRRMGETDERAGCQLPEIVPVLLGEVDPARWPQQIRDNADLTRFTLTAQPTETEIAKLLDSVSTMLRGEARRIVPAALFAMNEDEAAAWLAKASTRQLLEPMCQAVGMDWDKGGKDLLQQRYGPKAEDFSPFPGAAPAGGPVAGAVVAGWKMRDLVQQSLLSANRERTVKRGKQPLGIWWCTEELLNPQSPDFDRASELWEKGSSIAVVDSISALNEDINIYQRFGELPEPKDATTSALLWVPPYTLHTFALERVTEQAVSKKAKLLRRFRHWDREAVPPYVAFDIGTRPALRRWLHETFFHADVELLPDADALDSVRAQPGGGQSLKSFLGRAG